MTAVVIIVLWGVSLYWMYSRCRGESQADVDELKKEVQALQEKVESQKIFGEWEREEIPNLLISLKEADEKSYGFMLRRIQKFKKEAEKSFAEKADVQNRGKRDFYCWLEEEMLSINY